MRQLATDIPALWAAPTLILLLARQNEQRSLVKLAQVVRDAASSLLEALAGHRSLLSALKADPTSHAFRLPDEQAQETSQFRPTSPAWHDELDFESLSWCVWTDPVSHRILHTLGETWRNAKCDVLALWSHINDKDDIFVTRDGNIHKQTKKPQLHALGAGDILRPKDAATEIQAALANP